MHIYYSKIYDILHHLTLLWLAALTITISWQWHWVGHSDRWLHDLTCRHVFHPALHLWPLTQLQCHQLVSSSPWQIKEDKSNTYPLTPTGHASQSPSCKVNNTPHSIYHTPWAIYAHAGLHHLHPLHQHSHPMPPQSVLAPLTPTPLEPSVLMPLPFAAAVEDGAKGHFLCDTAGMMLSWVAKWGGDGQSKCYWGVMMGIICNT